MNKTHLSAVFLLLFCPMTYAANTSEQTLPELTAVPAPVVNNSNVAPVVKQVETTPAKQEPIVNCNFHISANTPRVDESIVSTWTERAIMQAFDLNYVDIDTQLGALKPCFTDQGWQGFNDALLQSGNIKAIKAQQLTVSSQMDGALTITSSKENLWKVTIPLQVVYQNNKEKLTQRLTIDLLIGRKLSGDLGIMQMIAVPRTSSPAATVPVAAP